MGPRTFLSGLQEKLKKNTLVVINEIGKGIFEKPFQYNSDYQVIAERLKQAESEVLFMGYKLAADSMGERVFLEALEALSKKAVAQNKTITVRMLLNRREGLAEHFKPNREDTKLRTLNADHYPNINFQFVDHRHSALGAYHTKNIIIDGETAILLSGDFSRSHFEDPNASWLDTANIIHGTDIVRHLRDDFIHAWNSEHCISTVGKKAVFDQARENAGSNSAVTSAAWISSNVSILYFSKKSNGNLFKRSAPSPFTVAVIEAIANAEYCIDIMTPNLNDPRVIEALIKANIRGVKINIILGKHHNELEENKPLFGGSNQKSVTKLVEALKKERNAKFDLLNIRWMTDSNGNIVQHQAPKTLHARVVMADNVVISGSSVLDLQSNYHCREGDFCVESEEVAKKYREAMFEPIFTQGIDIFLDRGTRLTTPLQDAVREIARALDDVIALLEHKENSLAQTKKEKKEIIIDVLQGKAIEKSQKINKSKSNYYLGSFKHLRYQVNLLRKIQGNQLQKNVVAGFAAQFIQIADANLSNNRDLGDHIKQKSCWYQIKERICDFFKKMMSQEILPSDLSTKSTFEMLGGYSLSKMTFLAKKYSYHQELNKFESVLQSKPR